MIVNKTSRWLRLFGLGLFVLLIWNTNLETSLAVLRQTAFPLMVIAVALNIPQIFLKSFRWRYLLNSQGIKYGIWQVTLAYFGSIFIGLLTPGRLGEFARAVYISSDCNVSTGGSFASVLADRLFDLYVLVAIGGTALISVTALNTQQSWAGMVLLTGGLTLALVLLVTDRGFALMQAFGSSLGQIGKRLFAPGNWLLEMRTGFRQLSWPTILISAGLTVIAYAVFFGQCYLLALALRLPVTFASVSCAVALGSLVTLLPISISGIGTRDAAIIAYLGTVGIPSEMALAFSLLVFLTFHIGGGLMGAVAWWIKPVPLGPLKSFVSSKVP